ncbi:MAG TPA: penicillin-binding protein 2 [Acidimicrobiales bacterium]|nr:penicillin-binding protein 2 [Acidimicrobiales bacterium]
MTRRTLRHPIHGDKHYPKPSRRAPKATARRPGHQPRMRPRRNVSVAALVASPEEMTSRPNVRLRVIGLLVLALFAVMVLRLWSLQVINTKNYAAAVSANQVRIVSLPAPRGMIVDRNSTQLVKNTVTEQIVLSRVAAAQHPGVVAALAALVGTTPAQVQTDLKDPRYSPYEPVPVLTDAPPTTVAYLQEHQYAYPGVSVEFVTQRQYPQGGTLAAHVLGYVGAINGTELAAHANQHYTVSSQIGKSGIEEQYEQDLRGVDGVQALSVNAQGQVVGTLRTSPPQPGNTVVLNLDVGLQAALQSALGNDLNADRSIPDPTTHLLPTANLGAGVVMDARTGQVLAMASSPTYDLNEWVGGISNQNFAALQASGATNNYATEGLFTPGSTFKLATATAALNDGVIGADQYVNDTGVFKVPDCAPGADPAGCAFHDAEATGAGEVNLQTALTISDDYYFYNLGYLFWARRSAYGETAIQDTANQYGFGVPTNVDLPGEASGRVDSQAVRLQLHQIAPKSFPNTAWYEGDNIEMAFGQGGTVVTPLQEAVAYATFANGGTRYAPQMASAVVGPDGKVLKRFTPQVVGHVNLPPQVYGPILAGLEGVVSSGTAAQTFAQYAHFSLSQYPIAGKTGTADVGRNQEPNAWFVGFGPTNAPPGSPEYVVAIVVQHGGYGAQAAAPAVMNVFNYLVTNPIAPVKTPGANGPAPTPPPNNPPAGAPPPSTTTTTTAPGH